MMMATVVLDIRILLQQVGGKIEYVHPYCADLIKVLLDYPDGLKRTRAIEMVKLERKRRNMPVPATFSFTLQSVYNKHCMQSSVSAALTPVSDRFFFPLPFKGARPVKWAVDPHKAMAWLQREGFKDDPR